MSPPGSCAGQTFLDLVVATVSAIKVLVWYIKGKVSVSSSSGGAATDQLVLSLCLFCSCYFSILVCGCLLVSIRGVSMGFHRKKTFTLVLEIKLSALLGFHCLRWPIVWTSRHPLTHTHTQDTSFKVTELLVWLGNVVNYKTWTIVD